MDIQNTLKLFLKEKYIEVPDEWITACIDWIKSENPTINMSNLRLLKEKVYEQWLYCDLTELATCSLPFGLQQKKHTTISGHFAMQVNLVRNVGQPAYAQLQKIQRADNANVDVSAEVSHQPVWEPKPSRMLMLQMTDGTTVVQGMEYRTIPTLGVNLKPGTKVLLSGTICVRRGVLFLTQELITVLGGEVEALQVTNAMENVIARQLGVDETENPRQYDETAPTQVPPSQASQYYPSQLNAQNNRSLNPFPPRRGGISSSSGRGQTVVSNESHNIIDDLGDDDFLDSDMEAALFQIEHQATSSALSHSSSSHSARGRFSNISGVSSNSARSFVSQLNSNNNSGNQNLNSANVGTSNWPQNNTDMGEDMDDAMNMDDFFNDDFGDEILISAEGQVNESLTSSQSSLLKNTVTEPVSNGTRSSAQSSHNISSGFMSQPSSSLSQSAQAASTGVRLPPTANVKKKSVTSKFSSVSKHNKPQYKQTSLKNFLSQSSTTPSAASSTSSSRNQEDEILLSDDEFEELLSETDRKAFGNEGLQTNLIVPLESKLDLTLQKNSGFKRPASPTSDKKIFKQNLRRSRSTKEVVTNEPPFTYLCFIPEKASVMQEFVVKGFIMTLVSRLEQTNNLWKLTVMINDGTASKEVEIDDDILRGLIGMSVEELNKRKAEARSSPELRSQLAKSVSGCQQKLISLCSLLRLRLSPNFSKPKLIGINSISSAAALQLKERLKLHPL